MSKITFKVVHLSTSTSPKQIPLKSRDKNGNVEWIDKLGVLHHGAPPADVKPYELGLNTVETYEVVENGVMVKKKRPCGYFTYLTETENLKEENVSDRVMNDIHRNAHLMLKTHQACVFRDKSGNDINPNRWGQTVMFELIEESQNILNQVDNNAKIGSAMEKATQLLSTPEAFIDFCYAYGMTKIKGRATEVLFNEMCQKILINPNHFLHTFESKVNETAILIRKGMEHDKPEGGTLIHIEKGFYLLNGEILGDDEDKAAYHLNSHPKLKEYLANSLGEQLTYKAEVTELAPVSDHPYMSEAKKLQVKASDEQAVKLMKTKLNAMFTKTNDAIRKEPAKRKELLAALEQRVSEKRSEYATLNSYFESHVEDLYKHIAQ